MKQAEVVVVPYDSAWPRQFEEERRLILATIGQWISGLVEHIGSTAVPGLCAKSVIDIMVGVQSLEASRDALPILKQISYVYFPYKPDIMHWLCKPSDEIRTHHMHIVPVGSPLWRDRLTFRDFLRQNPDAASEYAALKLRLAGQFGQDREAYTDSKGPFIQKILERARSQSQR
jgi:GrpB-like predicted nucleotidyltransferase (UPF0157 family)